MKKVKHEKVALICLECGKKFKRSAATVWDHEIECPRCHGLDIDTDHPY